MLKARKFLMVSMLLGALAFALFLASPAVVVADTTYSYTGNPFDSFSGGYSCPPECSVSGSFTVSSALAPNLSLVTITPTTFSFTDGNMTWNPTDASSDFVVSTDATGAITAWFIGYEALLDPTVPTLLSEADTPFDCGSGCTAIDFSFNLKGSGTASVVDDPGTWVTTPEPASLALLGTALCGLVWTRRRR